MKTKTFIKQVFILFLLTASLYSKETITLLNQNEIYFLPTKSKQIKDKILTLMENSKKSIVISMYNFSYKKFAKQLIKASKRALKVKVYLDYTKVKNDDTIYKLFKKNEIEVKLIKDKLHTKIAIFDDDIFMIGSSNWTKESFKENNEVILFTKDKKIIKEAKSFLESL